MNTTELTESQKVRDSITCKQDCIDLFEDIDNYSLIQALTKEDKIEVLKYAVPDKEDGGYGWTLDHWVDRDYRDVVDGVPPELAVMHVPSKPRTRLSIESVRKYLEEVERSFGKQISDHPDRKSEFERLWSLCSRSVSETEVYEDATTYVDSFLSSFTSSIYLEESYLYTSPEASISNNDKTDQKGTFLQVEGVLQDSPDFYDHDPSSNYLLDDLDEDEVYISLNSYVTNNDKKVEKGTYAQVRGRKWELGTDFYSDESMMHQIEYRCRQVKAPYDSMEDMIAEAFVQYAEMKAKGEITGEKNAAYYAQSAVNRMIDRYRFDNRKMRRSVDTVPMDALHYLDIEDHYGDCFYDWYEGLTRTQKAAVDDAKYKVEREQKINGALKKRLGRVPKPPFGTTVHRYGSTNLREEYSYMRKEEQPEPREVTIVSNPVAKRSAKPTKLMEMIENGVSNKDILIAIPAPTVLQRAPETAGEGKDVPNGLQKPTAENMNDLRRRWEELLEDQLSIDTSSLEEYQVRYKLDYYEDCLILPEAFEGTLQELGIDTDNYKEMHEVLCLDIEKETKEVA